MLFLLASTAYAMGGGGGAEGQGGGGGFSIILPLLLIMVIFYFLLIRPQQRAEKRKKEMISSVKKGYRVITAGGIRGTVAKVYEKVSFYTAKLDSAGIKPGDVKSLAYLRKLPFTLKDDLRINYLLGLLAVGRGKVLEIHGSSGTTGKPIIVAYTEGDIDA